MTVHYSEDGVKARCGHAIEKRLRGLDYTTTWDPSTAVPVSCVDCLFHRPPIWKIQRRAHKKAKTWV